MTAARGGPDDYEIDTAVLARLLARAVAASEQAYCPYSHFPVGAAVLDESGEIFAGCNVENASFGLTICAERSAIFQAVAAGQRRLRAILVYTPTGEPTAPCGACRQVIAEFGPRALIYCCCKLGQARRFTLPELLPGAFGPADLGREDLALDDPN